MRPKAARTTRARTRARTRTMVLLASSLATAAAWETTARADASSEDDACFATFEDAQVQRRKGQLRAAKDALRTCARDVCPPFVRRDCAEWLGEVERSLPSLVFVVSSERGDETNVRVSVDGAPLTERVDGKAVAVDPGEHVFRFELAGHPPREQTIVVKEGEKNRVVSVAFGTPARALAPVVPLLATPAAPAAPTLRPVPFLTYVFGSLGLAGVGGFTFLRIAAGSETDTLRATCAPFCSDAAVSGVRQHYVLSDVSLGFGLAAIGAATVIYLTRGGP